MVRDNQGGFAAMPYRHCSGPDKGRALLLIKLLLAAVLSITLATTASAQSLKAYKSSGSMVFKTDGGSVSNAHGATIGKIEGNSYYGASGSLKARLEDRKLYNSSGSLLARFDGNSIYNARGSLIGKLDNESLSDSHGATIGKIEGAGGPDDPATVFFASLLLGIM
jgi:hypothetical protein